MNIPTARQTDQHVFASGEIKLFLAMPPAATVCLCDGKKFKWVWMKR